MSPLDRGLVRALFALPPERAHAAALAALQSIARAPGGAAWLRARYAPADEPVSVGSLRLRNIVGLAAGYDKDAAAVDGLVALGFGHVELGTVTPLAQPGNPGVRVVRLPEHRALVNRLGFPGLGVDTFRRRLAAARARGLDAVIGVNLGRNAATPNERAAEDYVAALRAVAGLADYVTVNISSPNTASLRDLHAAPALEALLRAVIEARDAHAPSMPVWVKLSPDTPTPQLAEAARVCEATGCAALVVGNTTLSRPVTTEAAGGLSGPPLASAARAALDVTRRACGLPIVAVGGVSDRDEVRRRVEAGASAVQVYTALVYEGPRLLRALRPVNSPSGSAIG